MIMLLKLWESDLQSPGDDCLVHVINIKLSKA
jgi:hypothetical protein